MLLTTVALTGGQPVAASPVHEFSGAPTHIAAAGGGFVVVASTPKPSPSGPPDDWYRYHHWTDPSWPDPSRMTGEPSRPAGGHDWVPPTTPAYEPPPSTGWTATPGDPTDPAPGTPTGSATVTGPPYPTGSAGETDTPSPPRTAGAAPKTSSPPSGQHSQGGALPEPSTEDPLPRDPVVAGPDDDLGLGDTVDEPTPEPSATGRATAPPRAEPVETTPASEYQHTLVYSGAIGLTLAAVGLMMVGLRRRRW
ncbi:hypothetical protein RB614_20970 [Phytohabitans sp. ZYX-F-186]|uniref:Gram-positive cocci surface proteins LPxTG domain-containing protein n=1 Tax=Phytohabitans maris TaxID=3071409 RepID=A0ABU0ZIX7_9ACTN|nr:hypothetical protein [Phytohabitans sp. ZYX-F-186]MDQ7906988.1 hypothetical protein [Phytohabitans sp. ZYX-F-186]